MLGGCGNKMKIEESLEQRIKNLIQEYLGDTWHFKWSRAIREYGSCSHTCKIIHISKPLAELNDWTETKDTVLHEIAHALAGSGHGHDDTWKNICKEIGATPERCYGDSVERPPAKYVAICPKCQKIYLRNRMPRGRRYSCSKCSNGCFNADYLLEFKNNPFYQK